MSDQEFEAAAYAFLQKFDLVEIAPLAELSALLESMYELGWWARADLDERGHE